MFSTCWNQNTARTNYTCLRDMYVEQDLVFRQLDWRYIWKQISMLLIKPWLTSRCFTQHVIQKQPKQWPNWSKHSEELSVYFNFYTVNYLKIQCMKIHLTYKRYEMRSIQYCNIIYHLTRCYKKYPTYRKFWKYGLLYMWFLSYSVQLL